MKTTNNLQKTENKKFRVSISKTFAVVTSLVLISFTVSANGFWKQVFVNNSFGKMAIMMVDQTTDAQVVPTISEDRLSFHSDLAMPAGNYTEVVSREKALEVESWMISERNFSAGYLSGAVDQDSPLALENWMTDDRSFSAPKGDPGLSVEAWMTNESVW